MALDRIGNKFVINHHPPRILGIGDPIFDGDVAAGDVSGASRVTKLAVDPDIKVTVLSIRGGGTTGAGQDTLVEKQIGPLIEGRYPDGLEDLVRDLPGKLKIRQDGAEYRVNILYSKNNVVLLEAMPLASKSENEYLLVTFSGNQFSDVSIEEFEKWRRDNLLGFESPNIVSSDQINPEFQFSPLQPSEQYESALDETLRDFQALQTRAQFETRRATTLEGLLKKAELERAALVKLDPRLREKVDNFDQFVHGLHIILYKAGGEKTSKGFTGGLVLAYRNYAAAKVNLSNKYKESDRESNDDGIEERIKERIKDLCDVRDSRGAVIPFGDRSGPVYTEQERFFLASRDHLKQSIEELHEAVEEHLVNKSGRIKLLINNEFKNGTGYPMTLTNEDFWDITYEQCTEKYLSPRIIENIEGLRKKVDRLYKFSIEGKTRRFYVEGWSAPLTEEQEEEEVEALFITKKRAHPSVIDKICQMIWDPKCREGLWINLEEAKREMEKQRK